MKFDLSTAGHFYTAESAKKLEELGFQFDDPGYNKRKCKRIITNSVEINISSLEELLAFSDKWGQLIINSNDIIIFYDDYCE